MADFTIKQGDLLPVIQATLATGGTAVNLTGCSVTFNMATGPGVTPKISAAATVVDAANGVVQYVWSGTDTNTFGTYDAEWKVTNAATKPQRFPTVGYLSIDIEQNPDD